MDRRIGLKCDDDINRHEREHNGGQGVARERFSSPRVDLADIHAEDGLMTCGSDGFHAEHSTLTAIKLAGRKTIVRYEI